MAKRNVNASTAPLTRIRRREPAQIEPALLTFPEAATYLGVGTSTLYDARRSGRLPSSVIVHVGQSMRISRRALDEWIDSLTTADNLITGQQHGANLATGERRAHWIEDHVATGATRR